MTTHKRRTDQALSHDTPGTGGARAAEAPTLPAWPLGDAEMAGRIRGRDWAATPLGPAAAWPQSLRTAVDMMLAMPGPATVLWGPAGVQLYNDAYVAIARDRHPALLGRPAAQGWPDAYEAVIAPLLDAARAGRATRLADFPVMLRAVDGEPGERVFDTAWSPVRDEAGAVAGVLQTLVEVTDHHRTAAALRASETRQAFLLKLSDALRPLGNPVAIREAANRVLGEHMGADRACCVALDETPSLAGEHAFAAYGATLDRLRAGGPVVLDDVETDPETRPADLPAYRALGLRAFLTIPLIKNGELACAMCVVSAEPRRWTAAEVALVEETAERTWAAVERARAEAALRVNETRFRAFVTARADVIYRMDPDWGEMRELDGHGFLANTPDPSRSWLERYIHPDDQPGVLAVIEEAIRTKRVFELEHRVRRVDGSLGWTLSRAVPLLDAAGGIAEWFGTARDVTARKEAEAHLRESEARLAAMFESLPVGVGVMAMNGTLVLANPAMHRFLPTGIIPSRDPAQRARWRAASLEGRPAEPGEFPGARALRGEHVMPGVEMLYQGDDGRETWTSVSSAPIQDGEGRTIGGVVVVADTDAARRAAEALLGSEERLRQFAEASSDVLWVRNAETLQWEYLSPAFEAIYGLPCAEALSGDTLRNWASLIHPEDRERAVANIKRVGEGERMVFEYRVRRPVDGQVRWLRNTDFPMRDAAGRIVRIGGAGQDVTELKAAGAAVAASEARLRTLVEGIPQLVWRAKDAGRWTWASPQWCAYTGLTDEASHGLGWLQPVHPDDRDVVMAAWRAADAEGGEVTAGLRLFHAGERRYRWFQARGVPVHDDQGGVVEWLGTLTDIEDQVRSREELEQRVEERTGELMAVEATLRQAQKMDAVGQLTGGIAHDFNNMLQGIAGSLELARRRSEQGRSTDAARYVESARETVRRAAALTHRLLAFSRQQVLDPEPVYLDALVMGMAEMIRRTMGPEVQVEVRLGDGAWPVLCDESQLENALLNLCVNARDAMPDGGWLTISTGEVRLSAAELAGETGAGEERLAPGAYDMLAVADTGAGMDAATQARVFEPFYTTKPLGQGTGLGLSQVYGFVRQSGGLVRLDSTPGQGTTVRLYLPRQKAAVDEQDRDGTVSVVLLVEDEEDLRAMAVEWLREAGLRVLEAPDGAAALRLLHGGARVDLLATDVGLPGGINGRQVADAARARWPSLPVLFMTGYAGGALRGAALPAGMEVIGKPFALDDLTVRVRAMLEAATADA